MGGVLHGVRRVLGHVALQGFVPRLHDHGDIIVLELLLTEIFDERVMGSFSRKFAAPAKWQAAACPLRGAGEEAFPPPAHNDYYPGLVIVFFYIQQQQLSSKCM